MFEVDNNENTRMASLASSWCFYCYLWTYFRHFSIVSIVDFQQVSVNWEAITWALSKEVY